MKKETFMRKLCGFLMILTSIVVLTLTTTGQTSQDKDAACVLLMLPLGIYLLLTKQEF